MTEPGLAGAFKELEKIVGKGNLVGAEESQRLYGKNEIAVRRRILGAIKPCSAEEMVGIVKIATRSKIKLYPISRGNNWGYGAATPVLDDCMIVDLSGMNRITSFDKSLGLITLEPGVTTKMVRDYLDANKLPYLVPVSGGGPDVSVIGNALERGYGITPYVDHFFAVTSLKAVLPDGSVYSRAFEAMGCPEIDRAFKWGVGPYLDGLFTQGSFGIVTEMTIALAPIPESVTAFIISAKDAAKLDSVILAVQDVLKKMGNVLGSINVMNAQRVLSMVEKYPQEEVPKGNIMSDDLVVKLLRKNLLSPLTVGGIIYGDKKIARAAKKYISSRFSGMGCRKLFFTKRMINFLLFVTKFFPDIFFKDLKKQLVNLDESFKVAEGAPTEIALPLCYWKAGKRPEDGQSMNPAKDDCGVIWYSPLIPMKAERVERYFEMVKRVCKKHGIEPLITLTSLSFRCFDSTVPILFDPKDPDETSRAKKCYMELFSEGKKEGFLPYRVGIDHMDLIVEDGCGYWDFVAKLKKAVDPDAIISPGRYCPM